jgi:oligopeptide transport system substrate-binding protein
VTAADFEYAFRRLFDPATASEYAYLMYPIKGGSEIADGSLPVDSPDLGVKAIDDKTLEFTLEGPTPFFLQALTHTTGFPVPRHVVEEKGADWTSMENIVSNGPFTPVEWVPGNYVKAVKSTTYYDAANVQLDEIMYYVQDDLSAAFNRYRAGEYDILTDLPNDQQAWVTANLPGEGRFSPFAGVHYYSINETVEPFDDVNVRTALSMAINREIIGPDIWGTGEPVAYSVVPPGTANYEGVTPYRPEWADWPYDQRLAEAKKLMEAAGYTAANPLALTIRYNTNENHQRLAVAISAMWAEIGVKADLFNAETPVHYGALEAGDFQVGRAGWLMDYSDASNMLDLFRTGTTAGDTVNWGNNYSRYSNPKFDELTAQAAAEPDLVKRAALLGEAEALAMQEVAVIPLVYYLASNVVKPNIQGFEDNPKDIHRNRWITKTE